MMPPEWVNLVMTTQTSHMPDPYDAVTFGGVKERFAFNFLSPDEVRFYHFAFRLAFFIESL